ncbi:hypothetical protein ILUMI_12403 [Ignelater luminosus]|uniref:EGF-like domain-containing protein n=1 Tax=Ignelater luminosus TaxID=2038154 RepID=A0A8K0D2X4_IGNLU|nr:hypothetical protein ILUMI_12403 [Ignelater luminosus]
MDSNDVELFGRIASFIQPSKTVKDDTKLYLQQTSMVKFPISGEGEGAPQGRSLSLSEPLEISPTATTNLNFATLSPQLGKPRQANPDIQDIITGIVKLLNGNVNVQANTAPVLGRPIRPLSTRINNRGPPRITDVPALPPDLGQIPPPITPTKVPTPYPFDIPPQNTSPVRPYVPLLDSLHPGMVGFHRPVTIPPWNRPNGPHRRPIGPYRRPKPPFKPIPIYTPGDSLISTSEKPTDEDILTLDLGSELQPSSADDEDTKVSDTTYEVSEITTETLEQLPLTESNSEITEKEQQEILNYEKNKEKSSSKMEKHTSKPMSTETLEDNTSTTESSAQISASYEETPVSIAPSKVVTEIVPTTENSTIEENVTTTIESSFKSEISSVTVPALESSIQEVLQTLKEELMITSTLSTTSTEKLPSILPSSSLKSTEKINTTTKQIISSSAIAVTESSTSQTFPYYPYRPRPGIVLDDTEYKPGGVHRQPILTARPPLGQLGDIFDITVSAIQGPGGSSTASNQGKPYVVPVDLEHADVITTPVGDEGFVSIDGKRTYLDLFGNPTASPSLGVSPIISPTSTSSTPIIGTGYAIPEPEKPKQPEGINGVSNVKPTPRRPLYGRRPSQPPVRIDTCIVGDDSTCDTSQHEVCRTEAGVSACHCSPGHARRKHRDPCRKIVSMILSLRVDRLYERRVVWANELSDKASESYQQLSYETERAMDSAMSMTPFSDEFLGIKVNGIYRGERSAGQGGVFVNITLQLEANSDTSRPTVRADIQRHLLGVIQRRSNNVGNSALWVDSPPGSISNLQDLDECASPELHDCHSLAKCINIFGGFKCECGEGLRDLWADNKHQAGRHCEQCSPQHCNNRGECKYQNGQEVCICSGNYYGSQCEVDGEILGVAIGASVAAVIIIGLTLVCLVMWSRRWNKDQKAGVTSPVFGYMGGAGSTVKTPVVGGPPYQVTMEDRIRWAQIADVMAQSNHYAPEPVTSPTRPSSAVFGTYHGTLPPVPMPRLGLQAQLAQRAASVQGMRPLDNSSSSEEEDRADLLGRNFQVPRPKSRSNASIARGTYHGTLPPVPMPRLGLQAQLAQRAASVQGMRPLDNSSSSEEEDRADLLGRNFQVPRPKSRSNASIASGIYYDVDYEQNEIYKQGSGIPMSTYTIGRPYYRS